ncbi:cytochrome c [Bacillus sp. FJAT-50079]|nr:cytochrome c [Bacillus sp. FJAT-50079]MBS4208356.1 cytochrome c [Bacillus sp. FJAT-50079]
MGVTMAIILSACGGGDKNAGNGGEATAMDAEQLVNRSCISCHGENLEGRGNYPALNDVGSRLTEAEILDVIENGRPGMPKGIYKGEDAEKIAEWLAEKK